MDRKQYNTCMKPYISGTGMTKEERRLRFCIGAKLCSGKAETEDEAMAVCLMPKPEKPKKVKGVDQSDPDKCEKDILKLAACIAENADMNLVGNINSLEAGIADALMVCVCQKQA